MKTKCRASLTVEAIFLFFIVLAISMLLISFMRNVEKHAQLYSYVESAANMVSTKIYYANRLAFAVGVEKSLNSPFNLLEAESKMSSNVKRSPQWTAFMLKESLKDVVGLSSENELNKYFCLDAPLEIYVTCEQNTFYIESKATFQLIDIMGIAPRFSMTDVHAIPLKDAKASLDFSKKPDEKVKIFVTDNGLNSSHVYHTHTCWAMNQSKTTKAIVVRAEQLYADINVEGCNLRMCKCCQREAKEVKN